MAARSPHAENIRTVVHLIQNPTNIHIYREWGVYFRGWQTPIDRFIEIGTWAAIPPSPDDTRLAYSNTLGNAEVIHRDGTMKLDAQPGHQGVHYGDEPKLRALVTAFERILEVIDKVA